MNIKCKYCGKEIKHDMPRFQKNFCSQSCCYIYYMREGETQCDWSYEEKKGE
jgi:hypothetical protein